MFPDPKDTNRKNTDSDIQEKNIEDGGDDSAVEKEKEVIKNSSDELAFIKGNPDVPVN